MARIAGMLFVVAGFFSLPGAWAATPVQELTFWNQEGFAIADREYMPPPKIARAMAILHVAIFDAVSNAAFATADARAVVASAASTVLNGLYPAQACAVASTYSQRLNDIADGAAKTAGLALGAAAAEAVLEDRAGDNSDGGALTMKNAGGIWVPTPPYFAPPILPTWGSVTPFSMISSSQFRKAGPPALDSTEWAGDLEEVRRLGGAASTERTDEQALTARFWASGPGTSVAFGIWNAVALSAAAEEGTSFTEQARLLAFLNIAMADAGIACWDMKYHFNFWRPVTALEAVEPGWQPYLVTPPFPEYVSGHSSFSGAAAEALALFFGTDAYQFDMASVDGTVVRHFTRFSAAAMEAGMSRIYGGIHYQFSNVEGLETGQQIARQAWATLFKPQ